MIAVFLRTNPSFMPSQAARDQFPVGFTFAGQIDTDNPMEAFSLLHDNVGGHRSTSVGDVLVMDGGKGARLEVDMIGFNSF